MKRYRLAALALALLLTGCARQPPERETPAPDETAAPAAAHTEAQPDAPVYLYLGVEGYGSVDASQKDAFRYRFYDGSGTVTFTVQSDGGAYAVQNRLQSGRAYHLELDGETITAAEEIGGEVLPASEAEGGRLLRVTVEAGGAVTEPVETPDGGIVEAVRDDASETVYLLPAHTPYTPPVTGTPGERTVRNFLRTALMPVGTTLYVYGGAWNWQDDGASVQATSVGLPDEWVTFFQSRDAGYSYKAGDAAHSFYPFGRYNAYFFAGADCSGYVGWALYNTMYDRDGEAGFVDFADRIAADLSARGWGTAGAAQTIRPGDIMSMSGHVWIALGSCADGSVVIAHSTPSASRSGCSGGGVQLSAVGGSTACEAYRLAQSYMTKYYPQWTERYPVTLQSPGAYRAGTLFAWDTASGAGLRDPDGVREMTADAVLALLFRDAKPPV